MSGTTGALGQAGSREPAESDASTVHRIRAVLAIRPFRRLWGVTYLCGIADWLSLFALTGLITKMTGSYLATTYAFSGVVLIQLLPGLIFAPLGGLLADRFDRRKVMVVVDLVRCGLFLSIAVVDSLPWLFVANFLIGSTAMMWIPAKDSAIPNLMRRKDQVETASQLSMMMTYGITAISAGAMYALVTGIGPNLHWYDTTLGVARIIVIINGLLYLGAAAIVALRIPEISGRSHIREQRREARKAKEEAARAAKQQSWFSMFSDGVRFAVTNRLIRGLFIGMFGALAAGGAVIATATKYAQSLLGGDSAFALLLVALLLGVASGMTGYPKLARRMPHNRLFGVTIVVAGLALVLVAISPHVWFSLVAVALVGGCAGVAFLTGVTIIGTQVEDSMRGRTNAVYQALLKVVPFLAMILVPLLVGMVQTRHVQVFGRAMIVDGTRPVLLGAGVLAALAGVVAYRQMGDRSTQSILSNLVDTLRRRPRKLAGLLIAVEGNTQQDTAVQAAQLVEWLSTGSQPVRLATDPSLDEGRLAALVTGGALVSARAHALVAAAVRADVVERQVLPALTAGELVVMERYVDSPLAQLGAIGELEPSELEGLADWATGKLRPDITVLLDRDPSTLPGPSGPPGPPRGKFSTAEHHWRVQLLLTEMAAADPDRYVVVEAEGSDAEVAQRIRDAVTPALAARKMLPEQTEAAESAGAEPLIAEAP
jgi:dTMP kinase